jgi:hypothetical protein
MLTVAVMRLIINLDASIKKLDWLGCVEVSFVNWSPERHGATGETDLK